MTRFTPTSAEQVREVVAWAAAEAAPLEIVGHGTKSGIGNPLETDHVLDLSRLCGVTLYEPEELVMSAGPGTPLAEIEALLAAHRQQLAFEPIDYGPLLGGEAGQATIGGVFSANLSGPRRLKAGAARDHLLGVEAVSGRGEAFKSGGRVVKNVTGYDLSKGLAGSWGTLAALTKVTFKVLPAAATEATIVLKGLTDGEAVAVMAAALASSAEVSAAAHLPPTVAGKAPGGAFGWEAATLLRLEGVPPSVAYRARMLRDLLAAAGTSEEIGEQGSQALWRRSATAAPSPTAPTRPSGASRWRPRKAGRCSMPCAGTAASMPSTTGRAG